MTLAVNPEHSYLPVPYAELPTTEPGPFAPCVVFVDSSSSMASLTADRGDDGLTPVEQVNRGLAQFARELKSDELARNRADIAIVEFNNAARCLSPFTLARDFQPPRIGANGCTAMGAALEMGYQLFGERRQEYRENGVKGLCGMGVLLTDGFPTDDITRGIELFGEYMERGKIDFFCAGTSTADFETLRRINPSRAPLRLADEESIVKLFRWISDSLKSLSRSKPGEANRLPPTDGWGSLVA